MALTSLSEVLKDAEVKKYAVGAFNAVNLDMARGIILAAEEERSPVIISLAEVHLDMAPLDVLGPVLVDLAEKASIPVVVHLDHGSDFSVIMNAMKIGFTSVMIDGSALEFEQNIEKTQEIVKVAKTLNVSVEAEVGRLVTPETGSTETFENLDPKDFYTDPIQAQEFVEKTEVDALAIAFGTAHGLYKSEPQLDFNRIKSIKDITGMPLVMHGGSGLSDKQYKEAIENGITKINYYSDMANTVSRKVKEKLNNEETCYIHDVSQWTIKFVTENIKEKMRVFGSSQRG